MIRNAIAFIFLLSVGTALTTARAADESGTTVVDVDLTFVDRGGATFATRKVQAILGIVETVTVHQNNRTVSLEASIRAGAKAGCHKIDFTLRDRTIDSGNRFNKTVWQSASEPCGPAPITLGPKDEMQVRVSIAAKPGK
jgi:hypothetical protein